MKPAHAVAATLASLTSLAWIYGCAAPKPPEHGNSDNPIPLAVSSSSATADTTPPPAPTASATASASSAPSAEPPVTKKPRPAGSPMAVEENDDAATTTYGHGGGKILIAGVAELFVPPGAVDAPTNFTLEINTGHYAMKGVTLYKGQIGDAYHLGAERPEAGLTVIASLQDPFQIKLPLKGKTTANLAIFAGKGKWIVIAPKQVEDFDKDKRAVFEMSKIPKETVVMLTSADPAS